MAEGPAKTMEDLLTCSLCLELFREPKTLRCLHSYCLDCLKEMTKNAKEAPITCPLCRDETTIPPNGVDHLQTNFFIKNMLDVVELKAKKENPHCTNCDEGLQASCRCVECEDFFCQKCLDAHNRLRNYLDHRVVDLKKLGSPQGSKEFHPAMKCEKHEMACKFYCQTCNVLVCRDCTVVDHLPTKHSVTDLKHVANQCRERFDEAVEKAENHISHMKNVQENTRRRREKFQESLDDISILLKRRKENLIQQVSETLESQVSEMLSELQQFVFGKIQQDEKDENQQGSDLKKVGNYVLFIKNLLKSGNDDEMMNMFEPLVRALNDCGDRNPLWFDENYVNNRGDSVKFFNENNDESLVRNAMEQMKTCLGELCIPKNCAYKYRLVQEKDKIHDIGNDINVVIEKKSGSATQADLDNPDLGSFKANVLTPQQTVIPAKVERRQDGSLVVHFTSYINGRHRLAVRQADHAVAGSPMTVEVKGYLDYSPGSCILQEMPLKKWDRPRKTFSLYSTHNGNFAFLVEDRVFVLDPEFNVMYSFGDDVPEHSKLIYPSDISVNHLGHIIVADIGRHQILVYDKTGTLIHEISAKGQDIGQLYYPIAVAADQYCNIAVCDTGNHRIQIFKPDGAVKVSFGDEDKTQKMFPVAIELNSRGHIVVSESLLWTKNHRSLDYQEPHVGESAAECVKIFNPAGQLLKRFGEPGDGKGQFWAPIALTVDSQDHIWVADVSFGRIQIFDEDGNFVEVHSSDEEKKGPGWFPVLTTAVNGAILYYRSYLNTS